MTTGTEDPDPSIVSDAFDPRRLRYFLAVAEEMHFGRAAERLGIAQPPLSRQIARLEQDLGALLVDRSRSQIRLTQAGQALRERGIEILARIEDLQNEIARIGAGKAGLLRIGFVGSATHGVLPEVIKGFRAAHPDVELVLAAMNNAGLKEALIRREIDVAIARPRIVDDTIVHHTFHAEPLILALPEARGPAGPIALATLRDAVFILYPQHPRPSFADHVLGVCAAAGFRPSRIAMAMDYQTAISLVSVGVGVSLVPRSVAMSQRPGVAFRAYVGPNPGTELSVNHRIDHRSPQLWSFLKAVRHSSGHGGTTGIPDGPALA